MRCFRHEVNIDGNWPTLVASLSLPRSSGVAVNIAVTGMPRPGE